MMANCFSTLPLPVYWLSNWRYLDGHSRLFNRCHGITWGPKVDNNEVNSSR